jgi:hypothetical protein
MPNSSTADSGQFRIRVYDAADQLIHGGRVYHFAFPCSGTCSDYTPVSYTAS